MKLSLHRPSLGQGCDPRNLRDLGRERRARVESGSAVVTLSVLALACTAACAVAERDPAAGALAATTAGPAGAKLGGSDTSFPPPMAAPDARTDGGAPTDATRADTASPIVGDAIPATVLDPGKPAVIRGPKCWGHFEFLDQGLFTQDFPVECTAVTNSTAAGSQLYLEFSKLPPGIASAYVSILLATTPWEPGLYSTVRDGRLEVTLRDGRQYRTYIASAPDPSGSQIEMTLQVDTVAPAVGEPSHTIKGQFDAELRQIPSPAAGASPLFLHLQIDAPAPPGPAPTLQLDCRNFLPGAVDVGTQCSLTDNATLTQASCRQLGGIGGFGIRVLDPAKVKLGEPISLADPASNVRVEGWFTTSVHKPSVLPETATGYFIVEQLVRDKLLVGRFINATIGLGGDATATCRIGETRFEALPGR
jgi:hypothetical protein